MLNLAELPHGIRGTIKPDNVMWDFFFARCKRLLGLCTNKEECPLCHPSPVRGRGSQSTHRPSFLLWGSLLGCSRPLPSSLAPDPFRGRACPCPGCMPESQDLSQTETPRPTPWTSLHCGTPLSRVDLVCMHCIFFSRNSYCPAVSHGRVWPQMYRYTALFPRRQHGGFASGLSALSPEPLAYTRAHRCS